MRFVTFPRIRFLQEVEWSKVINFSVALLVLALVAIIVLYAIGFAGSLSNFLPGFQVNQTQVQQVGNVATSGILTALSIIIMIFALTGLIFIAIYVYRQITGKGGTVT